MMELLSMQLQVEGVAQRQRCWQPASGEMLSHPSPHYVEGWGIPLLGRTKHGSLKMQSHNRKMKVDVGEASYIGDGCHL